jgi:hypothetical protein
MTRRAEYDFHLPALPLVDIEPHPRYGQQMSQEILLSGRGHVVQEQTDSKNTGMDVNSLKHTKQYEYRDKEGNREREREPGGLYSMAHTCSRNLAAKRYLRVAFVHGSGLH